MGPLASSRGRPEPRRPRNCELTHGVCDGLSHGDSNATTLPKELNQ
jgi:hypothetical protein